MLPINVELVKNDECSNNGAHVYLYFCNGGNIWIAYGYSAYALRLLVKDRGYDSLRAFSDRLQMPCTVVSDYVINIVKSSCDIEQESSKRLHLILDSPISEADYTRWVNKINQMKGIKDMNISTPVSAFVPKDQFITDGMSSLARCLKRVSDCILALIAMIVFFPLFIVCYVLIKREDGGDPIFKQERIGRFGRPFCIYKFRSMRMDAEKMGPQLSKAGGGNDPRLTRVGKFIRAHHLDELPQLYNVFKGDMSFVGPRPERKFYIDQIMEYDKRYVYLYQIRPGVTSLATLYNGYTDSIEKMLNRLEYDLYYLKNRSWWLDMKLVTKTFFRIVFGKIF